MNNTVFGMTEAQIVHIGLTWGIGALIALMLFIIWKLARDSKSERLGTFILFFVFVRHLRVPDEAADPVG